MNEEDILATIIINSSRQTSNCISELPDILAVLNTKSSRSITKS